MDLSWASSRMEGNTYDILETEQLIRFGQAAPGKDRKEAVYRSALDWKAFRPESIMAMATEASIPEADRQHVADYVRQEFRSLHEGNVIRYRLRPENLTDISRE